MAAPTSQPNSREPSHQELVEPASPLKTEELKEEPEQGFCHDSDELEEMEGLLPSVKFPDRRIQVEEWEIEAQQFETDFSDMEMKIHRFPASLQRIEQRYISPMVVGIGVYHHNSNNLHEMEKVKRVAAHHFVRESSHTFDEMYEAVCSVIGTARGFYDAKVDVGDAEFADIMFMDGCFLLQYMLACTNRHKLPPSLVSCFRSNQACINNDIMLLENQLPWLVVDTVRRFSSVPVEVFIRQMGAMLQIKLRMDTGPVILDGSYRPPHLLGILWFYKTGSVKSRIPRNRNRVVFRLMSKSISAIELGEIGIKLTANKTAKFTDMGVKRGFLSSNIFLAPLLLDDKTLCWLVNMVAFEVSVGMTAWTWNDAYKSTAVVSSHIALLAMLMEQEEDMHELRSKGLVQGEPTNKETLDFFKMLAKPIKGGPLYGLIMLDVEAYKRDRWMWICAGDQIYKRVDW